MLSCKSAQNSCNSLEYLNTMTADSWGLLFVGDVRGGNAFNLPSNQGLYKTVITL